VRIALGPVRLTVDAGVGRPWWFGSPHHGGAWTGLVHSGVAQVACRAPTRGAEKSRERRSRTSGGMREPVRFGQIAGPARIGRRWSPTTR